jgi:hypothetical protein
MSIRVMTSEVKRPSIGRRKCIHDDEKNPKTVYLPVSEAIAGF